ncbi:hypothetical protein QM467_07125 [Rhodoblastus sp. 17X3]|uniref:hypothetical protein n=1 Tax=Rhodoblastus sp. 17X3 TaxID=3047026 RepID=UPI0024B70EF1|nr:hypothetical protein [Rhodoblastus sp. 17X3]MDI9847824.1 hypothetical protein [Rhodoblastus sp. 17X3]
MVEIIVKSDGPRREDVPLKRFLRENRSTITRLADHLSNGNYSASKVQQEKPQAENHIIMVGGGGFAAAEICARVRSTRNGRVIAVDENSGKQLHHIGQIARKYNDTLFLLVTKANGFFAPVDDEIAGSLSDLDGTPIRSEKDEEEIVAEIGRRLGMV